MADRVFVEVESYDIKMFSAKDVSDMFEEAHEMFKEYNTNRTAIGQCDSCKDYTNNLVAHWNDVGATKHCKSCWCESIVDSWMQEKAAGEQTVEEFPKARDEYNG
jgi:hypothetical protein